ncbi:MAG: hypothetical protein JNM57_03335 [Cyclobacteriaceae bacterium]|nr:hypothetical protein [Cyclobacteriaceae bacterium]
MKKLVYLFVCMVLIVACQDSESTTESDFTGNESSYALLAGSTYPVTGTVFFKEKKDGSTFIRVELSGTEGEIKHPVHLHLGDISTPGADVTALLNPVLGKTGISETELAKLSDESTVTYKQLTELVACVKIHLSEAGPEKDIVLAGGNIGKAAADGPANGRVAISVCKSE